MPTQRNWAVITLIVVVAAAALYSNGNLTSPPFCIIDTPNCPPGPNTQSSEAGVIPTTAQATYAPYTVPVPVPINTQVASNTPTSSTMSSAVSSVTSTPSATVTLPAPFSIPPSAQSASSSASNWLTNQTWGIANWFLLIVGFAVVLVIVLARRR